VVVALLVCASLAEATIATLRTRARLRTEPSASGDLVGWVEEGSTVEIVGERGGWREVDTPQGHGFIWGEHLVESGAPPPEKPPSVDAPAPVARSLADEVRELREEVRALRERPEPATAADLERLRVELERMVTREGRIGSPLDAASTPIVTHVDPPPESALLLTPLLLATGGAVGWAAARLASRRRERRQRSRLRL
jgi:hypothetical protein